ncbi:MAG: HgcAB-associated protein [Dehalococcoidales bacterium]|nr:HgcAB-associated protein [Dehalococcoidales bacterium]
MVVKKKVNAAFCEPTCCQVESIITVDERGQMVLPKETRAKAGIKPGDKLALVTLQSQGKPCCLMLMKTDELSSMAKNVLGPLVKDLV